MHSSQLFVAACVDVQELSYVTDVYRTVPPGRLGDRPW